ncbi:MAG: SDR family oxidoreductase [Woeseiaceae bacterium]|nr:SDR family oxidoreductase [Woeseiaceae bacterium]
MRVLVLGGYGFIGLEIARQLIAAGHDVVCVGRSGRVGRRLLRAATWIEADLTRTGTPEFWREHLQSTDVVVNAAGALQSGLEDDVEAIHDTAVADLSSACEKAGVRRFIQISAVGAAADANTAFMRSKARGEDRLRRSTLDWIILRPGLVIGANARGGTALLRAIAGTPIVLPVVFGDRLVQTVALSDLVAVLCDAVEGRIPPRTALDIVEDRPHSLRSVLVTLREWLGMAPPRMVIELPEWLVLVAARVADGLGHLGWRSPLRTTTMQVLSGNVVGDAGAFRALGGRKLMGLDQTLASLPATAQERWFARLYLLLPVAVAVLSAFWLLSGLIALADLEAAAAQSGLATSAARFVVAGAAVVDLCLGAMILYRRWAGAAAWCMVVVGIVYLVAGSVTRPDLWADPLGPLVKILPATMLALVAASLLGSAR